MLEKLKILPNIPDREIDMTSSTDIGAAVRLARRTQGLTQPQLAAVAGVGVRFLVDLEAGKSTAQLGKTLAVLSALGLSAALVDRAGRRIDDG